MRIFRLRSLSAANATAVMIGGIAFSQFFLLTLYMQDVLGYSAIRTGVGFATMTFTIIVFSQVGQRLVTRYGVRSVLTAGLLLDSVSLAMFTQLPAGGHYFWSLFPGMVVGGIGLALSFVPVTIAGLTGVSRADAGIASGLINTSRQVGGAVGLAGGLDDHRGLRHDRLGRRCPGRPHPRLPGGIPGALGSGASGRRDRRNPARTAAGAR